MLPGKHSDFSVVTIIISYGFMSNWLYIIKIMHGFENIICENLYQFFVFFFISAATKFDNIYSSIVQMYFLQEYYRHVITVM